ncbi:MAG: hypothetical protein IPP49_09495 [Saprospiraceae bacterium]|nr:hypothetical protein [Saprospiraceae bacterium]
MADTHAAAHGSRMMESYDFHILDWVEYVALPVKVYHILNILERRMGHIF